jgi:hypothetical protein
MKYQAEANAVYEMLFDLEDLVDLHQSRFSTNQLRDIISFKNKVNHYLSRRLPLKAKKQVKGLDKYIQQCLYYAN